MSHTHFIRFKKDISGKPKIEIKILLFLKFGKSLNSVVYRLGNLCCSGTYSILGTKDIIRFIFRENKSLTDKPVLRSAASLDDEIVALKLRQMLCYVRCKMTQRRRYLLILLHHTRFVIPLISAVNFVSTFS